MCRVDWNKVEFIFHLSFYLSFISHSLPLYAHVSLSLQQDVLGHGDGRTSSSISLPDRPLSPNYFKQRLLGGDKEGQGLVEIEVVQEPSRRHSDKRAYAGVYGRHPTTRTDAGME
jgi:hypothetical protein